MKNNEINKFYLAEIVGSPSWNEKTAISFLLKDEEKSEVKIFDSPRKDAVKIQTNLTVLNRSSGGTTVVMAEIHFSVTAFAIYIQSPDIVVIAQVNRGTGFFFVGDIDSVSAF